MRLFFLYFFAFFGDFLLDVRWMLLLWNHFSLQDISKTCEKNASFKPNFLLENVKVPADSWIFPHLGNWRRWLGLKAFLFQVQLKYQSIVDGRSQKHLSFQIMNLTSHRIFGLLWKIAAQMGNSGKFTDQVGYVVFKKKCFSVFIETMIASGLFISTSSLFIRFNAVDVTFFLFSSSASKV